MDTAHQSLLRYAALSLVAMVISLVLLALISQTNTIAPQSNTSARTMHLVDDDSIRQEYLYIENNDALKDSMQEDYILLLDQLLLERYQISEQIERYAVTEGRVSDSADNVSFSLRFLPSDQVYDVTATKRTATKGVFVTMEPRQ